MRRFLSVLEFLALPTGVALLLAILLFLYCRGELRPGEQIRIFPHEEGMER